MWTKSHKADPRGRELADRHYSRRKIGAPQFMPPGETLVLVRPGAVWGWWRPHPSSGLKALNGLDGWTCSLFRNESQERSSDLILAAETALIADGRTCGPDGFLTYVFDRKVASRNPGYCYKMAGYRVIGRSKDMRKTLLWKPFELAGISACGVRP